jgi:hypothetical protein
VSTKTAMDKLVAYISVIVKPTKPVGFAGGLVETTSPFVLEEARLEAP